MLVNVSVGEAVNCHPLIIYQVDDNVRVVSSRLFYLEAIVGERDLVGTVLCGLLPCDKAVYRSLQKVSTSRRCFSILASSFGHLKFSQELYELVDVPGQSGVQLNCVWRFARRQVLFDVCLVQT
jgi:hypothetical protein